MADQAAGSETGARTYTIDRNINYTNICVSGCGFCAFYKKPGDAGGYVLSVDEILGRVGEAVELGASQIMLQGGLNPDLDICWFEDLFCAIKANHDIWLHSLSAPEIVFLAEQSGLSYRVVLERLKNAGLDSLPGGGAEILTDRVRGRVSPGKCSTGEWLQVMRDAASLGMRATATMVIGLGECMQDRVDHLEAIRQLQDETLRQASLGGDFRIATHELGEGIRKSPPSDSGAFTQMGGDLRIATPHPTGVFTAFIPWTFQPGNTALGGLPTGAHDYLKTLALSRLYLDNIAHIQASWVTQGRAIATLALRCGADDIGSVMIEENVVAAAGINYRLTEQEIKSAIEDAGFAPVRRDTLYGVV